VGAALAALAAVLTVTVVPGVLTVDENSYLASVVALRQGRLTVSSTDGLPPSNELLAFDPAPKARRVTSTPVASNAPPLYAPLALPFSFFGWRGLVALNTLAFVLSALAVFRYAERYSSGPAAPWLAAGAFTLGAYNLEYAQGMWPHMLAVGLCTAGVLSAGLLLDDGRSSRAVTAGFMLALAAGVRYQNAVVLVIVGVAILTWARSRWKTGLLYACGACVPLMASSVLNHVRQGSWNPISKGAGYLPVQAIGDPGNVLRDGAVMLWARVIDFSARPPLPLPFMSYDAETGAHLVIGYVVKKSVIQSAPWAFLALLMFALAWFARRQTTRQQGGQLRFLSVVMAAVLLTFAAAGIGRHDGLAFNERYLLEVVPFLAIAFAWSLETLELKLRTCLVGWLVGAALALMCVLALVVSDPLRGPRLLGVGFLAIPIVLAAIAGAAWFAHRRASTGGALLTLVVFACLGWGFAAHFGSDLQGSRRTRAFHAARTMALAPVLPDRSALVGYYWQKEAVIPLSMNRDITVVNAWVDDGRDAPALIAALQEKGRRVFVLTSGFPPDMLTSILRGKTVVPIQTPEDNEMNLVEILRSGG
jgi:hypothetical protein